MPATPATSPRWPASIAHQPQIDGLQITPHEPHLRTDMERGPARVRRTSSSLLGMVRAAWEIEGDDMITWDAWYRTTLGEGARWFWLPVYWPAGYQDHLVRHRGVPSISLLYDTVWRIEVELDVRRGPPPSAETAAGLASEGAAFFTTFGDALHRAIHVILPGADT